MPHPMDTSTGRQECVELAIQCCGPAADADHVVNVAEKFRAYIKDGKDDTSNVGQYGHDGSRTRGFDFLPDSGNYDAV